MGAQLQYLSPKQASYVQRIRVKALAHYKDFRNDFSKKIVVKIIAHV